MTTRISCNLCMLATLIGGVIAPIANGDELLPPDRPIPEVIDHYLDRNLKSAKVTPAGMAELGRELAVVSDDVLRIWNR